MANSKTSIAESLLQHFDAASLQVSVLKWGKENFRNFPWRLTQNPYSILLSEVMLHRTRAAQVAPVYEEFISKYPNHNSLVRADEAELHQLLHPLGLQWRLNLVYNMALDLEKRFSGKVPREKVNLMSLPGISDYIASAVRCFAWNEPEALIDTNTVRVIGRVFGLQIKDSSRRNATFRALIASLVSSSEPRLYNYGLLDLAAQLCHKRRPPDCSSCPIFFQCTYGQNLTAPPTE